MSIRPLAALSSLLLTACAPECPVGFADQDGTCVFDEEAVLDLVTHFDDGSLVKINEEPFMQVLGDTFERNVWMSELPLPGGGREDTTDLYRRIDPNRGDVVLDEEFPVGTLFIHEAVNREEGHGVLVRRDDLDGDTLIPGWWAAKVFDDGTFDLNCGMPCEMCHAPSMRPDTQSLWGVPLDAR